MHFMLVSLTRLLGLYYRFRPIITAFFFSLLVGWVGILPQTIGAQPALFTLQFASCDTRQEAHQIAAQLRQHGINTEVSLADIAGRGEVFRVRAGKFTTITAARESGEQWRAAHWITSYWVARVEEVTVSKPSVATATANTMTRKRVVAPEKPQPEMGLGELLSTLSNKWAVSVPENFRLYSAVILFPQARVVRPAVVLMDEARLHALAMPNLKRRELLHPLELRTEPGVKNSPTTDGMKFAEAERLAFSLRAISGLPELTFDERGILVLGNRIEGGSDLARTLLRAALASDRAFEIESQEGSDAVVFGAFLSANFKTPDHKRGTVNKIQLDFHDFDELRGDPRLLEAFDPGFVFLHELAHGVWDLADDEHGGLGECETFINQIRRQLGLPERLSYFYKVRRQSGVELGEMMFVQPAEGTRRRQALKLLWDNRAVNSYSKPAVNDPTGPAPSTKAK